MRKDDKISSYVAEMSEYTIMEYEPQAVVVDIVNNFWMKHFSSNELRSLQASEIESKTKKIYLKSHPNTSEETLNNFAADVLFHLIYELTELAKRKTWSKF